MNGEQGDDILTMKLAAADGDIEWRVHRGGPGELADRGWDVAVGPDGHPVVTGIISTSVDPAYYCTLKLDSADGSTIWSRTVAGAVNHIDREAGWLAICDDGDVVMANRTWVTGASYDVVVQRYAGADGATVWQSQYDSPASRPDDPEYMTRDAAGDLLVAGLSDGNYMVLKFDEENGDLLWAASHDGASGGYDAAACVIEGPGGEIIATGFTDTGASSWDVTTVAFDPATGAELWADSFDGGDSQADEGMALAVSALGDLYVVGYSYSFATASDQLALRYEPGGAASIAAQPLAPPAVSMTAAPNPFSERLNLSFEVQVEHPVRVAVYDALGRQRLLLYHGPLAGGSREIVWNGRDRDGRQLEAGVYFVRLESADVSVTRKIVMAR